jgi:hypothetical protein
MVTAIKSGTQQRWVSPHHIAVLYGCIFVLGVAFYGATASRNHSYATRVQELDQQLQKSTLEMKHLNDQIYNLLHNLSDLKANFSPEAKIPGRDIYDLNIIDLNIISIRHPHEAQLLRRMLELCKQGVRWNPRGQSPEEGFDSAGFAAFVLREANPSGAEMKTGESLRTIAHIWKELSPISQPASGDLVFYPDGYVLFHFEDQNRRPFVIGMTPLGILGLNPHFAKAIGCRRVGL